MARTRTRIRARIGLRLPGRVSQGSASYFRRGATLTARQDMASVISRYEEVVRSLKGVTPEAVRNALEPVYSKSQEYTPVDSGALQSSGRLDVGTNAAGQIEGTITYGDQKAWYAALVHEYVWLNHEPPTRAKYLQSALEEELDAFMGSLAIDYAMGIGLA